MTDDKRHATGTTGTAAAGNAGRDIVGELVKAGGRRPTPSAADYERVLAAAREAWQQNVRTRRRRRRYFALAAAAAILAIGVPLAMQLLPTSPPPVVASTAILNGRVMVLDMATGTWRTVADDSIEWTAGTRLRTATGNRISLDLAEGGSLRIDESTELTLSSIGQVELGLGTIYFDSQATTGVGALQVSTTHGLLRTTGTQFEAASSPEALRVRIREGSVAIQRGPQDPELTGAAGEQVLLESGGGAELTPFPAVDPEWSWVIALADAPRIDGRPLIELLDWIVRETGHELRFADPAVELRARTITMRGDLGNVSPMEALDVALATTDLDHVVQDDGVVLIRMR